MGTGRAERGHRATQGGEGEGLSYTLGTLEASNVWFHSEFQLSISEVPIKNGHPKNLELKLQHTPSTTCLGVSGLIISMNWGLPTAGLLVLCFGYLFYLLPQTRPPH